MTADTDSVTVPSDVVAIARRSFRLSRIPVYLLAGIIGAVIYALPPVIVVLVAVIFVGLLRAPIYRTCGTARLTSPDDQASVQADFESAIPPLLGFQWGIADSIPPIDDGATYDFSYLFGLWSAEMDVLVRSQSANRSGTEIDLELHVTTNGKLWGTYDVLIRENDGETMIDVEWTSDRRFGLKYFPQYIVAGHYRSDMFDAQGYTVIEWKSSFSLR